MKNLKKAKATAAVKTVAKTGTAKVAVSRNVTNEVVNRNRSYRAQLTDLKSGLKDCLNVSSRTYVSRFGEPSIWVDWNSMLLRLAMICQTSLMNCASLRFTRYAPTLLSWFIN